MTLPRLGKRRPHPTSHPHRQFKLARYATAAMPDPPGVINWSGGVNGWALAGNDVIGDCACVAPANAIRLWTAHAGVERDISNEAVYAAYRAFGGWEDGKPETDNGCIISEVLAGWHAQSVGIGGDVLAAFVEVDHSSSLGIRRAVSLFGCCILGVALPISAQGRMTWIDVPSPAGVVTVPSIYSGPFDLSGDYSPGSWGGHCVLVVGYDLDGATVVSWGNEMRVSWRWLAAYVDEAWAPLSDDWIAAGMSPAGVDVATLRADLAAMADAT